MSPRKPAAEETPTEPPPVEAVRRLTSGQLRAKAAAEKAPSKTATRPAPTLRPVDTRQLTVGHWSRGRHDALLAAFVSQHSRGRTVKRQPADWMGLYQTWLKQPRA